MKIQIIQLESHDDAISTRDKMAWCKAARILLLWPKKGQILTEKLDLIFLQRFSVQIGAQLGLVSRDKDVCALARELGIPTFSSVSRAQRSYWRHTCSRMLLPAEGKSTDELRSDLLRLRPVIPTWMAVSHFRLVGFFVGLLAVISLLVTFIPGAAVTIKPEVRVQQVAIPILANNQIKTASLTGNLPLRQIVVEVTGQDSLPTTGGIDIPSQSATGYVRFTNLTDQSVEIPIGTVVLASSKGGMRFITTQQGRLAAKSQSQVTIAIKAVLPGEEGNLQSGLVDAIDGVLGLRMSVTNQMATTGGTSQPGSAVSTEDLFSLRELLEKKILDTATVQIQSKLAPADRMIPSTLHIIKILIEKYYPEVDQPGDVLSLSMGAEVSVDYLTNEDLLLLATQGLNANLPVGYRPANPKVAYQMVDAAIEDDDGNVRWKIQAQRNIMQIVTEEQVTAMIPGLRPGEASQWLVKSLNLPAKPDIILFPEWWPRMPILPFRIAVQIPEVN